VANHATGNWRELCKAVTHEDDPKKMLDLIRELNRALSLERLRLTPAQSSHS
jgi:hypothetical protein